MKVRINRTKQQITQTSSSVSICKKYAEAKQCLLEAPKISQETGDKFSEATSYLNLGTVLESVGQLVKAEEHYQKSLEINKEIDNKGGVAASNANLGHVLTSVGKYSRLKNIFLNHWKLTSK